MFESDAVVIVLVSSSAYMYLFVKSSSAVVAAEEAEGLACRALLSVAVSSSLTSPPKLAEVVALLSAVVVVVAVFEVRMEKESSPSVASVSSMERLRRRHVFGALFELVVVVVVVLGPNDDDTGSPSHSQRQDQASDVKTMIESEVSTSRQSEEAEQMSALPRLMERWNKEQLRKERFD